jgi:hypothetical protein
MRYQIFLFIVSLLLETPMVQARELAIRSVSTSAIVCHADGYSRWNIRVETRRSLRVDELFLRTNNH